MARMPPTSPKTRLAVVPLLLLALAIQFLAPSSSSSSCYAADSPPTEAVCDVCGKWEPIISHDIPGVDCDSIIEQGFAKELTFEQCDYYQTSIREICCRLPPTTASPVAPTAAPVVTTTTTFAPTIPQETTTMTTTSSGSSKNENRTSSFSRIGILVGSIASCCLLLTAAGGIYVARRRRRQREQGGDGLRKFDLELVPTTGNKPPLSPPAPTIATITATTTTVERRVGEEQKEGKELV